MWYEDLQSYQGKYVALASTGKKVTIVASGFKVDAVIAKARRKGIEVPSIVFVPKKDVAYIY
jgi:hypothetical protein